MRLWCRDECYRAVQSCPRVPAAALFAVVQFYLNDILASFQQVSNVQTKGIVSVCPRAGMLAIDRDGRL